MERLISILRAAHCRSTHQFFVLDALPLVATESGKRLGSQLVKHYQPYLRGAKAPDKEFRDFRNHVVHVRDNHWGGAPASAQQWYAKFLDKIRLGLWSEAAYCAGVLSHYFTDPLMPLHTAQSEKESIVHRPLEWSVTLSYDRILRRYRQGGHQVIFEMSDQAGWLGDVVCRGAELSNQYYDELIDRYDLERGTSRPPEGLDEKSIEILAGLFGVALTGWARIIQRAADESKATLPQASLSITSLVASITMPVAWIVRRIDSAAEQKAVRAIFEEFRATGRVSENLPAEVRSVKEEREHDRQPQRRPPTLLPGEENQLAAESQAIDHDAGTGPEDSAGVHSSSPSILPISQPPRRKQSSPSSQQPPLNLAMSDHLVDAPSIGPKTAKRFARIGIHTVEEFLSASGATMARQLDTGWITEEMLGDWQDQARLVATVPGLCGYKSQLLVGVECRDSKTLAVADAASLHGKITRFAATSAGKRVLRSSSVPSQQDVAQWIADAARVDRRHSA